MRRRSSSLRIAPDAFLRDERHRPHGRRLIEEAQFGRERRVAQLGIDDAAGSEQSQILIGEHRKIGAALDQVMRRAALGEKQAEHLLVDLGLALEIDRPGVGEDRRRFAQVGAEPEPEPVADADDLAVARARTQRRRIEIGRDDPLARVEREGAVEIGARRCRHHLAQLVVDAAREAVRIVPEFLDLRRERAGAALAQARIERAAHLPHRGEHEAMPRHRGVLPRMIVVEQRAVFDEQQRVHDQRRDGVEISEQMLRDSPPCRRTRRRGRAARARRLPFRDRPRSRVRW